MTKEELRLKVAELCGWKEIRPSAFNTKTFVGVEPNSKHLDDRTFLPDYPNDLNACAEFEKGLTTEQRHDYVRHLTSIMEGWNMMPDFTTTFATAEQRCRAFVATMEGIK